MIDPELQEEIDFTQEIWKRTISARIKDATYAYLKSVSDSGFRTHLGASVIGHPCLRSVYYHFRWFKRDDHNGRSEGIFQDGHNFEAEMRRILSQMGAQFLDKSEDGKQLKFSAIKGHFGGSVDGIFIWPAMGITEPMLLECKSSKTGAPFSDLEKKQVMNAKNQHYIQNNIYMKAFNLKNALYICKNKNDWDLYTEIFELDNSTANDNYRKAELVILDNELLPSRIRDKRNFFVCNMCNYQSICHDGEAPVPNCRNCKHSDAVEDARFRCNKWDSLIPDEEAILKGCPHHEFRPY